MITMMYIYLNRFTEGNHVGMAPTAIQEMLCSVFNAIRRSNAIKRMCLAREVGGSSIQSIQHPTISFQWSLLARSLACSLACSLLHVNVCLLLFHSCLPPIASALLNT